MVVRVTGDDLKADGCVRRRMVKQDAVDGSLDVLGMEVSSMI